MKINSSYTSLIMIGALALHTTYGEISKDALNAALNQLSLTLKNLQVKCDEISKQKDTDKYAKAQEFLDAWPSNIKLYETTAKKVQNEIDKNKPVEEYLPLLETLDKPLSDLTTNLFASLELLTPDDFSDQQKIDLQKKLKVLEQKNKKTIESLRDLDSYENGYVIGLKNNLPPKPTWQGGQQGCPTPYMCLNLTDDATKDDIEAAYLAKKTQADQDKAPQAYKDALKAAYNFMISRLAFDTENKKVLAAQKDYTTLTTKTAELRQSIDELNTKVIKLYRQFSGK